MTHDRLVFGVTIDQIDELTTLLRTITAHGDALTFCNAEYLQFGACRRWGRPSSTRALPCGIFSIRSTSRGSNKNKRQRRVFDHQASASECAFSGSCPGVM